MMELWKQNLLGQTKQIISEDEKDQIQVRCLVTMNKSEEKEDVEETSEDDGYDKENRVWVMFQKIELKIL